MFEHHDHTINDIIKNQEKLMADVTALNQAVTENTTAVDAAVQKLQAGSTPTQAEVDALVTVIQTDTAKLNAA